jgi:hypothetical protein
MNRQHPSHCTSPSRGDGVDQAGVDAQPEHGGGGEQGLGVRAEAVAARTDRLAHALGKDVGVVAQPLQHLLDEEGVAACAGVDGGG